MLAKGQETGDTMARVAFGSGPRVEVFQESMFSSMVRLRIWQQGDRIRGYLGACLKFVWLLDVVFFMFYGLATRMKGNLRLSAIICVRD